VVTTVKNVTCRFGKTFHLKVEFCSVEDMQAFEKAVVFMIAVLCAPCCLRCMLFFRKPVLSQLRLLMEKILIRRPLPRHR
jgi:hypothetical protein